MWILIPMLIGGMAWAALASGAPEEPFPHQAKSFVMEQTDVRGLMKALDRFSQSDLATLLMDDETVAHVNRLLDAAGMPDVFTLVRQGGFSGIDPVQWRALHQAIEERFGVSPMRSLFRAGTSCRSADLDAIQRVVCASMANKAGYPAETQVGTPVMIGPDRARVIATYDCGVLCAGRFEVEVSKRNGRWRVSRSRALLMS